MAGKKPAPDAPRILFGLLLGLLSTGAYSSVHPYDPVGHGGHRVNCEFPFRFTHDCSPWQGATRPIAIGGFRMTLAADSKGQTILLSRVRQGPDHNGYRFRPHPSSKPGRKRSLRAVQCLSNVLEQAGIRLERMQAVQRGQRAVGYILEFSDNAYDFLKQFTVLESEHWLPRKTAGR